MKLLSLAAVFTLCASALCVSGAEAMPVSHMSTTDGLAAPVTKADVVVRKRVVRRPAVVHRRVVNKVIVR